MPSKTAILQPVFALVAWTICVLLLLSFRRFKEARAARVASKDGAHAGSAPTTFTATLANRNYINLLESPVLFYIACLTAFVCDVGSGRMLAFAWLYVGLRVLHSLIHVTYNRVAYRFPVFAASIAILVLLWISLALRVFYGGGAT